MKFQVHPAGLGNIVLTEHQDFVIFFSQKKTSKKEHKESEDIKNYLDITSPLEMFCFRTTFYLIYFDNPSATKLTET